jgi:tRNA U34 5-carboxymethylaminomethyl modifying GTPase MnmE/TrmE
MSIFEPHVERTFESLLPNTKVLRKTLAAALQMKEQALKVIACGMYNAGKSSLLNALTDQLENEAFATGPVRTTTKKAELSHHQFIFTDTPGLDAKETDDAKAWATIRTADVWLFVHNPANGELDELEIKFLQQLATLPGATQGLEQRLLLILSHLDSHAKDIENIANVVRGQIKEYLKFEPQTFFVSYTNYKKGYLENKQQLMQHSRIPMLQDHLDNQFERLQAAAQESRQARIAEIKSDLLSQLNQQISTREATITQLNSGAEQASTALKIDFERFLQRTQKQLAEYDKEYKSMS